MCPWVLALGKPDWAKPYLTLPTPTGAYIARNDGWVVVYGEIELALRTERSIEMRHRFVLENLADRDETFNLTIAYDEGQQELADLALNVQRTLWHEINLNRTAVKASVKESSQVVIASAEKIAPHRRVVLEYTLADRLGFNPWAFAFIPRPEPIAAMRVFLAPDAAARGLRLELRLPGGGAPPPALALGEDGGWTVSAVPAWSRITGKNLLYQPAWSDLYPYFLAHQSASVAASFPAYAAHYRKAWDERAKEIDSAQVREKVAALANGATGPRAVAVRLGSFVQHEIQYDDSNAKSMDSWLPLATQETLRSGRADCKAKVMLMQALLAAAGIESVPVLMRNGSDYYAWGAAPGTAFFNHVVLAVHLQDGGSPPPATLIEGPAKGWVLFDPTVTTAAFGSAVPGFEGVPALFMGEATEPVFTIHTLPPSAYSTRIDIRLALSDKGAARGQVEMVDNGQSPLLGQLLLIGGADDRKRRVVETLAGQVNQIQVLECLVKRAGETPSGGSELHLVFSAPTGLQEMSSSALLDSPLAVAALLAGLPCGFRPGVPPKPDDAAAIEPPWDARLNASGLMIVVDVDVTLSLPARFTWTPPARRQEDHPWVKLESGWAAAGGHDWKGTLHLEIPRGQWPAAERKARLKLMDELLSGLYNPVVLSKAPPQG
ncbi:MAG: transglutaminase family protein [Acidobacteriota bacterium]